MFIKYLLPIRTLMTLATVFIVWQAVVFMRSDPRPPYVESEVRAIEAAARALRARLEQAAPASHARIGVARFVNDPFDTVTDTVRSVLAEDMRWQVADKSIIRQFLGDISKTLLDATSLDEVANAARRVELDLLAIGRAHEVGATASGAVASMEVVVYDVRAGEILLRETFSGMGPSGANIRSGLVDGDFRLAGWMRLLLWLGFVLLLPWVTWFLPQAAVERKSNGASFALLVFYTAADLFVGYALVGFRIVGVFSGLLLLACLVGCAAYNYRAAQRIVANE